MATMTLTDYDYEETDTYKQSRAAANMKKCQRCKEWKSRTAFNRNKSQKDGLADWCRECKKAYDRMHYRKRTPATDQPEPIYTVKQEPEPAQGFSQWTITYPPLQPQPQLDFIYANNCFFNPAHIAMVDLSADGLVELVLSVHDNHAGVQVAKSFIVDGPDAARLRTLFRSISPASAVATQVEIDSLRAERDAALADLAALQSQHADLEAKLASLKKALE